MHAKDSDSVCPVVEQLRILLGSVKSGRSVVAEQVSAGLLSECIGACKACGTAGEGSAEPQWTSP